ncbi:hypothetical protein M0802_001609 [Mischocyttarus mexicanus]|nr:hypothetical protein M0802_001609 [Mischocyttarus mexicanus]
MESDRIDKSKVVIMEHQWVWYEGGGEGESVSVMREEKRKIKVERDWSGDFADIGDVCGDGDDDGGGGGYGSG